jgi:hypothetical protein
MPDAPRGPSSSSDGRPNSSNLGRRDLLKGALGLGAAAILGDSGGPTARAAPTSVPPSASSDAVRRENERPGDPDWQLTYTRIDPATRYRSPWIEGYASRASLRAGESVDLFVSTNPPAPFKIDIFRMGYYGGAGARKVLSAGPFEGMAQPDPPVGEERLRECAWAPTTTVKISDDWPSGVYLAKLSLVTGRYQSYAVFIVRDDRPADILFQCSDNTWQAYNRWPDNYSLYDNGERPWALVPGVRVSYDRPYGKYSQVVDAPLSLGSGEFLLWEFPLAYWLEQQGYDVSYCSNTDVHADPACLLRAKAFLSVGHDEYWSLEQYQHVQAAIAAGVNVAFLSGNTCCFVSPFSNGSSGVADRVITRAGRYGGVSEPERAYMGPFPIDGPNEALLIGARTISPFNGSGDYVVTRADSWLYAGTGMRNGDRIPGLIGWEFHGDPADIPGLEIVAEGETINGSDKRAHWTATLYPGPKDNWVFNASTIYWAQGLSRPPGHVLPYAHYGRPHGPDERVQQITRNLLDRFRQ